MAQVNRIRIDKTAPNALEAFVGVESLLEASNLDPMLRHLVKLRVSQINGCVFCVNMHTSEARTDGESNARLDHLVVWRHTDLFSDAEKAALAWAEAFTVRGGGEDIGTLHQALLVHFSQDDVDMLMLVVVMINTWNRLQIAAHQSSF
jgi:AhpD family alkylhydroperoxidase